MKQRFVVKTWFNQSQQKQIFGVYDLVGDGWLGGAVTFSTQEKARDTADMWERSRIKRIREGRSRSIFLVRDPSKTSSSQGNKIIVELSE